MVRGHRALRKKLSRDLRQNYMQFLAMMMLCFLGTWVFSGLDANWRMEERTIEEWLQEGELCDFWISGTEVSRQDLYRVRAAGGVREVQARITLEAECPKLAGEVNVAVHVYDGEPKMIFL